LLASAFNQQTLCYLLVGCRLLLVVKILGFQKPAVGVLPVGTIQLGRKSATKPYLHLPVLPTLSTPQNPQFKHPQPRYQHPRVHTSANTVKRSASKLAYVYQSQGCDSWVLQRVGEIDTRGGGVKFTPAHGPAVPQQCPETGARYLMGGPLWAEAIHDQAFVGGLIEKVCGGAPGVWRGALGRGVVGKRLAGLGSRSAFQPSQPKPHCNRKSCTPTSTRTSNIKHYPNPNPNPQHRWMRRRSATRSTRASGGCSPAWLRSCRMCRCTTGGGCGVWGWRWGVEGGVGLLIALRTDSSHPIAPSADPYLMQSQSAHARPRSLHDVCKTVHCTAPKAQVFRSAIINAG